MPRRRHGGQAKEAKLEAVEVVKELRDVVGTGAPSQSVFDWTAVVGALSTRGSQDGHVSLDIDLVQSGYASFDNLRVYASDIAGAVPEPSASILLLGRLTAVVGLLRNPKHRAGLPRQTAAA